MKIDIVLHSDGCIGLLCVIFYIYLLNIIPQARSQGGEGGQLTPPPLENQRSTFWNLAHEIIKANNYKWLTIYLHQLLCTKAPTKWLQKSP